MCDVLIAHATILPEPSAFIKKNRLSGFNMQVFINAIDHGLGDPSTRRYSK